MDVSPFLSISNLPAADLKTNVCFSFFPTFVSPRLLTERSEFHLTPRLSQAQLIIIPDGRACVPPLVSQAVSQSVRPSRGPTPIQNTSSVRNYRHTLWITAVDRRVVRHDQSERAPLVPTVDGS